MNKLVFLGVGVALVFATFGLFLPKGEVIEKITNLAGMTNLDGLEITPVDSGDGLEVGTSTRSTITKMITGTCTLRNVNSTDDRGVIVASTSVLHWCNVTGVTTGDKVFGSPRTMEVGVASTSPLAGPGGFGSLVFGATSLASTTDRIAVLITNFTGQTTTSYAFATTSFQYWILR